MPTKFCSLSFRLYKFEHQHCRTSREVSKANKVGTLSFSIIHVFHSPSPFHQSKIGRHHSCGLPQLWCFEAFQHLWCVFLLWLCLFSSFNCKNFVFQLLGTWDSTLLVMLMIRLFEFRKDLTSTFHQFVSASIAFFLGHISNLNVSILPHISLWVCDTTGNIFVCSILNLVCLLCLKLCFTWDYVSASLKCNVSEPSPS